MSSSPNWTATALALASAAHARLSGTGAVATAAAMQTGAREASMMQQARVSPSPVRERVSARENRSLVGWRATEANLAGSVMN